MAPGTSSTGAASESWLGPPVATVLVYTASTSSLPTSSLAVRMLLVGARCGKIARRVLLGVEQATARPTVPHPQTSWLSVSIWALNYWPKAPSNAVQLGSAEREVMGREIDACIRWEIAPGSDAS
jgi:hypothetical protein